MFQEGVFMNVKPQTIYDISAKTIEGEEISLARYKGKVLLIVNTASQCGYTPQYEGLQKLYETCKDRGFAVLGFPSNDFKAQEPGTNTEIRHFCVLKYNISFPMFSKITVKGEGIHPLYRYLTEDTDFKGEITWNFNKFLVDREGRVIARFDKKTEPLSDEVREKVEAALPPQPR